MIVCCANENNNNEQVYRRVVRVSRERHALYHDSRHSLLTSAVGIHKSHTVRLRLLPVYVMITTVQYIPGAP